MKRTEVGLAVLLVLMGVFVWFTRAQASEARLQRAVADAATAVAVDSANARAERLAEHEREDAQREMERADSVEVYRARALLAATRERQAREGAQRAAETLRATLTVEQAAQLDTLEAETEIRVEQIMVRVTDLEAELEDANAARTRAMLLFGEAREENNALRAALESMEVSLDARDAIISAQRRHVSRWQLGTGALAALAGAQALGLIGG